MECTLFLAAFVFVGLHLTILFLARAALQALRRDEFLEAFHAENKKEADELRAWFNE